jgi:sugar phosphate isomerase/epimerase
MRLGAFCPLNALTLMQAYLNAGFESLELIGGAKLSLQDLPSAEHLPPLPLIWQADPTLPAEYQQALLAEAVLGLWRQELALAQRYQARLMVVQFRRPSQLEGKAALYACVAHYIRLLAPLTEEARAAHIQLVLRMGADNSEQLQTLREIMRGVPGLGLALDVAYAGLGVVKNLTHEYLWDADLSPRLAHLYISESDGQNPHLRLPLGSLGEKGLDWKRLIPALRQRYNASITLDVGMADFDALLASRQRWLSHWHAQTPSHTAG